jgi:hypothetical protein
MQLICSISLTACLDVVKLSVALHKPVCFWYDFSSSIRCVETESGETEHFSVSISFEINYKVQSISYRFICNVFFAEITSLSAILLQTKEIRLHIVCSKDPSIVAQEMVLSDSVS